MSAAPKYDYPAIADARARGVSWDDLADQHGAPSANTLRSGFYRWSKTNVQLPYERTEVPEQRQEKPPKFHPTPAWLTDNVQVLYSRPDNVYKLGVVGDKHYGSRYHREDVTADLFRIFENEQVDAVIDTGNWIDGEKHFNRFDLDVHGLDAQIREMAAKHPRIVDRDTGEPIPTYAVWGDDHEGWYAQSEGIDVGLYAQTIMQNEGHAWYDLGFMEAHVMLVNVNTGASAPMAVTHPGGGSSYAMSHKPQKIVEALEGGEKPAVLLMGHYHKLWTGLIRNVWVAQTGCLVDQTPFMRKKSIEAHVGGGIVTMRQDPDSGAIMSFSYEMIRYFNRRFYTNNRWSKHRPVNLNPRSVGGI